jgi:poly-gamma-glutamate synthesis protein (capsule biosynthesis protein)
MRKAIINSLGVIVSIVCFVRSLSSLLVLLVAAISILGQTLQHTRKPEIRILFVGDILLSRQVEVELKTRVRSPWASFQTLFQRADWVGGNFEGAIGRSSDCLASKSPCFATPDSAAALLKRAGFYALTAENNHSGDLASAGRKQTRNAFQQAGLASVAFEDSPQFFHLGKTEMALLAITTIPAADGQVQHIPSCEVSQKLRLARSRANLVLVSIHWGNELMEWPSATQRKQAAWLVEEGADLVLGHHPHVIQRPECISGKPVFFSLGNHLFDQASPKTKQGLLADCRVGNGRLRCQGIRTTSEPRTTFPNLASPAHRPDTTLAACTPAIRPSN